MSTDLYVVHQDAESHHWVRCTDNCSFCTVLSSRSSRITVCTTSVVYLYKYIYNIKWNKTFWTNFMSMKSWTILYNKLIYKMAVKTSRPCRTIHIAHKTVRSVQYISIKRIRNWPHQSPAKNNRNHIKLQKQIRVL